MDAEIEIEDVEYTGAIPEIVIVKNENRRGNTLLMFALQAIEGQRDFKRNRENQALSGKIRGHLGLGAA